jgi:nucleotide-binding universal stress UspA family protein
VSTAALQPEAPASAAGFTFVQPGMVIDHWRVDAKLHKGGMATLWRVSDTRDGSVHCMKVPLLGEIDDPTAIIGFEQEQMILPLLEGVHVPAFHASGDFDRQPYIVMELIDGASLRPQLDLGPMAPERVADIGARVAAALHSLHQQGVIHLDVKPSNVMFRGSADAGDAVLVDYGLAHHARLPDLLAEQFRLPMGTGPYIAPEQVQHVRTEPRSDLFSLGVMMYFMLTGERPFGQPSSVGGLRERLWRDPPPPRVLRPDCPPWLQELILACLERDPGKRPATAAQLAFELRHPQQIRLTARATRTERDGAWRVFKRWLKARTGEPFAGTQLATHLQRAPILMVAVDLSQEWAELAEALRGTVARVLQIQADARLACVTVLRTHRIAIDERTDEQGRNLVAVKLAELQHWARPLGLRAEQLTFHVLESPDPAQAIIDYAAHNQVDHIVVGCRGNSALRRYLGSVSAQVVAQAPCSVTVVRVPARDAASAARS